MTIKGAYESIQKFQKRKYKVKVEKTNGNLKVEET